MSRRLGSGSRGARAGRRVELERGSMSFEMVILTPVLVMFMLLVVAGGRYVAVRGDVEAASRDAARAASLERDPGSAAAAAQETASAALHWNCRDVQLSTGFDGADPLTPGGFVAGGVVRVSVTCDIPYNDLGLIGWNKTRQVTGVSYAPLDVYRRTG